MPRYVYFLILGVAVIAAGSFSGLLQFRADLPFGDSVQEISIERDDISVPAKEEKDVRPPPQQPQEKPIKSPPSKPPVSVLLPIPAPLPPQLPPPTPMPPLPVTAVPPHPEAVLVPPPPPPAPLPLPPLDEQAIFRAVVKIECPSEDRRGKYVGAGFLLPRGVVVTAAHVIMDSGSDTCTVIFPKDRHPSHYLTGVISEDRREIKRRHDEEGIDVAVIFMPQLAAYPEARAIFPEAYPSIPYPICDAPAMLGDKFLHYGYPSNFLNQSYLSQAAGQAAAYGDIKGFEAQLTEDQTAFFKTPVLSYTTDQRQFHPYMVSRVATFYGDSGGLAFNADKQCIVGPHRGGTIGGGAGENFSIFMVLGWERARQILPP